MCVCKSGNFTTRTLEERPQCLIQLDHLANPCRGALFAEK